MTTTRARTTTGLALALATTTCLTALSASMTTARAVPAGIDGPLVFTSDAKLNQHNDVFTAEPDGSGRVNLTGESSAYLADQAEASPDGRRIAFVRSGEAQDEIWVMDADGSDKTQLTDGAQADSRPTWSPDGEQIGFTRAGAIWTMTADGEEETELIADASAAEFSPDGLSIAFVRSDQAAGSRIWVRESGGATTARTAFNDRVFVPSWSPDGTRLLFWHDSGDVEGLYTMSLAGTDLQLLKAGPLNHFLSYTWSPSGTRIAYTGISSGNEEIWVMDADGTDATQVTDLGSTVEHSSVSWSTPPDLDPTSLADEVQDRAMTPVALPGPAGASYSMTGGQLPDGLTLSPSGVLSGTPAAWGTSTFEVTTTGGGPATVAAYRIRVLDPEDPNLSITSPGPLTAGSVPVTLSLDTRVAWLASDGTSGAAEADIRMRSAAWNGAMGGFVQPAAWQGLGTSPSTSALNHPQAPGRTYCYSGRARDTSGRLGGYGAERCIVAPVDDSTLAKSGGWKRVSGGAFYGGKALRTTKAGKTLKRTGARLVRVGIVASTCPTCGKVAVLVGSTRVGTVNLRRGSTTLHRKVFLLPAFSERTATVTVRTLKPRRTVIIDALVISAR